MVLKKGVFEVALLSVHHTHVVVGRGHVRSSWPTPVLDIERAKERERERERERCRELHMRGMMGTWDHGYAKPTSSRRGMMFTF